jgi:hypothetical protein
VHAREDFRILDVKEVQLVIFFTSVTGDIYIYIEYKCKEKSKFEFEFKYNTICNSLESNLLFFHGILIGI